MRQEKPGRKGRSCSLKFRIARVKVKGRSRGTGPEGTQLSTEQRRKSESIEGKRGETHQPSSRNWNGEWCAVHRHDDIKAQHRILAKAERAHYAYYVELRRARKVLARACARLAQVALAPLATGVFELGKDDSVARAVSARRRPLAAESITSSTRSTGSRSARRRPRQALLRSR